MMPLCTGLIVDDSLTVAAAFAGMYLEMAQAKHIVPAVQDPALP